MKLQTKVLIINQMFVKVFSGTRQTVDFNSFLEGVIL